MWMHQYSVLCISVVRDVQQPQVLVCSWHTHNAKWVIAYTISLTMQENVHSVADLFFTNQMTVLIILRPMGHLSSTINVLCLTMFLVKVLK